ncbi:MAG: hypothetical protein OEN01_14605, partial [Candidatus Krumholzibacteria bacterium]|nr:hypothetical protein [Candidatus Krumholzibacteria bacterium]
PATAYRIMTNDEYSQSPFLHHIDQLAMCLVTIGERLEGEVQRQKEKGELGRALLFDAFGSAVAEATADAAETIIQGAVAERGLRCSQRFSPGYSGWRVDEQEWILPALDGQSLGVALTEGCMMCPRKSITFAMTIGDHPVEVRTANICDSCGAVNCPLRHTPHNCFGKTFE